MRKMKAGLGDVDEFNEEQEDVQSEVLDDDTDGDTAEHEEEDVESVDSDHEDEQLQA